MVRAAGLGLAMLACGTIAIGTSARAQDGGGTRLLDTLQECRGIAAAAERLACYDKAAAAVATARANDDLLVMDRGDVREKRRKLFGFQMPRINLFGKADDRPEVRVTQLDSTVRSARPTGRVQWIVTLADGSVWRTLEQSNFDPKPGETARIKAAAMGSYRANFGNRTAVRIERVE